GGISIQLFARIAYVQALLQSAAESLRYHAGSLVFVSYQETQRGSGRTLLRSEAPQRICGFDRRGRDRKNRSGSLPAAGSESGECRIRLRIQSTVESDGVSAVCSR